MLILLAVHIVYCERKRERVNREKERDATGLQGIYSLEETKLRDGKQKETRDGAGLGFQRGRGKTMVIGILYKLPVDTDL
ncbi:hypothetical protein QVD17_39891 [Tagetes erecta]|uniref:Uncharacterized protein n=1 Tax=Tagetes erecta TaxID=13708 RepID=A0AAD8NAI4_TARER|nr:hypothetical protein QVD17_39891 [Tagetes erecta]